MFVSPLLPEPSLRDSISIFNTHTVVDDQYGRRVFRGMEPRGKLGTEEEFRTKLKELEQIGITHVLIFKLPDRLMPGEKETVFEIEKRVLTEMNFGFTHIPFPWKNMKSFEQVCNQTLAALQYIKKAISIPSNKVFFHCTTGEDRTGYLSGLIKMITENQDLNQIFNKELCEKGFEHGNPYKQMDTVGCVVRKNLTPLFLKMVYKIERGEINWENLSDQDLMKSVCKNNPINEPEFFLNPKYDFKNFRCAKSSLEMDPAQKDSKIYPDDCKY